MKTITLKVYPFSELSDDAKQFAHSQYLNNNTGYSWDQEWTETLNKFVDTLGFININDWYVGTGQKSFINWEFDFDFDFDKEKINEAISGKRLLSFVFSFMSENAKGKTFFHDRGKFRESNLKKMDNYFLTGYCGDYCILEPIFNLWKSKAFKDKNLSILINECFDSLIKSWLNDMEYECSMEAFEELSKGNELFYESNGTLRIV